MDIVSSSCALTLPSRPRCFLACLVTGGVKTSSETTVVDLPVIFALAFTLVVCEVEVVTELVFSVFDCEVEDETGFELSGATGRPFVAVDEECLGRGSVAREG